MEVLQSHGLGGDHGLGVSGLRDAQPQESTWPARSSPPEEDVVLPGHSSQEQWWKAAARTTSVVQLPRLTELACDGHLVAFLAINLFNAAIVMIVIALSDPLTNAAQEAKRAIARIYRLQGALGARSSLSKRSIIVLRDLVLLLSRRESEAMLLDVTWEPDTVSENANEAHPHPSYASVRETLEMPLGSLTSTLPRNSSSSTEVAPSQPHSRFNDGLASVQRAFTIPAFLDSQHAEAENIHGPALAADLTNFLGDTRAFDNVGELPQFDMGAATVSSEWSTGSADASNGFYWFWDPMWDCDYGTGSRSGDGAW